MPVKTEDYDEDAGTGVYVKVKVGYTPKYPEEAPTLDLEDAVNLDENGMREELLAHLDEQASIETIVFHFRAEPHRLKATVQGGNRGLVFADPGKPGHGDGLQHLLGRPGVDLQPVGGDQGQEGRGRQEAKRA